MIRRRGGDTFIISKQTTERSPFDVEGVDTGGKISREDIVAAIHEGRKWPRG